MSAKSLWIGPLFGIGCVSLATIACSGDVFTAQRGELAQGGSEPTSGAAQGGKAGNPPEEVTPASGGMLGDGGAPPELPDITGGSSAGSAPHAGGSSGTGGAGGSITGGSAAGGAPHAGGSSGTGGAGGSITGGLGGLGGSGGNVIDPPIDPTCQSPIAETWTEPLSKTGLWHTAWGDPVVDTAQHRLVLSYDDVAERGAPYNGSYYVESDVTIVGGTAFTPYPYTSEVLLPTLRRDAAGSGIQLGATQYGPTSWSASGWADLSGSVIAGASKLHVVAYMQVTSKKFALKVSYAGKVYRSAWVTDFHWANTNLGVMRYVGENNSSVYSGKGDLIYVDSASGCQGLSDAAVAGLFTQ